MTKIPQTTRPGEAGYVLVASLVTLLLLTVLGIWASRTTSVELATARNEQIHQETFYQADAGAHLAERLIYHNMLCGNEGFDSGNVPVSMKFEGGGRDGSPYIFWNDRKIRKQEEDDYNPATDEPWDNKNSANYTFQYFPDPDDKGKLDRPHTNVLLGHEIEFKSGQGLLQSSGYEGFGSGAANVGYYTRYRIRSQHIGRLDSEYEVEVEWRLSGLNVAQIRDEDCHYGAKTTQANNP